ncbi:uncharacterized protein LOC115632228 [Scaptodrosophila lebanonensis]|uniref:Tryptophan--tRNA ligase, mitochondrial n=1 Tax=Drosophila lebanonensis TaxID=7225 RepID=A0A6J2UCH8_DROLE|nr:uncharacterized protein LOC115632228 [Scaptodrosophila lebanonensis]
MFRAGKLNAHGLKRQPMSLARRMFKNGTNLFQRIPVPGSGAGSISATAQVTGSAHLQQQQLQQRLGQQSSTASNEAEAPSRYPRKIFSGIQPTGALHLGNYLGAVRRWTQLQNARDDVTICIVDLHSITMPHNPPVLRENIFEMAATLLACGIDPAKTTLFVQSAVLEHCEFNWILSSLTTMPRLAQLPQFKEKSRTLRDVPLGLYVYPVLQAADIMLYKATHVPVGADQLQHIQLAQHLSRSFNSRYGEIFPVCQALIEQNEASRVLSLRDPSKKMSKSENNPKATININDAPDVIAEKIKKAVTDFTSDISFNLSGRPGVSNLVNIHALVTGQSIKSIVEEAKQLDTARYKERVADAVIAHLQPIREQIQMHLAKRNELIYMLEIGAEKARQTAQQTMSDVKQRLGLGTNANLPAPVRVPTLLPEIGKLTASQQLAKGVLPPDVNAHSQPHYEQQRADPGTSTNAVGGNAGESVVNEAFEAQRVMVKPKPRVTVVPFQSLRVEKQRVRGPPKHVFKMDTLNVPSMGFRGPMGKPMRRNMPPSPGGLGFTQLPHITNNTAPGQAAPTPKYGGYGGGSQNANPSAVAAITSAVNAATRQQEMASSLANSSFYKAAIAAYKSSNTNLNTNATAKIKMVNVNRATEANNSNIAPSVNRTLSSSIGASNASSSSNSSKKTAPDVSKIGSDEEENSREDTDDMEECSEAAGMKEKAEN